MDDPVPTPDDMRSAWRDATRAAQLAERLVEVARDATGTGRDGLHPDEVATFANAAAEASMRAATSARAAASEAVAASQAAAAGPDKAGAAIRMGARSPVPAD